MLTPAQPWWSLKILKAEEASNGIVVGNSFKSLVKEDEQEKKHVNENIHVGSVFTGGTSCLASFLPPGADNIMPSSSSQVDPSVLEQLPEELQVEIRECLPPHRKPHVPSNDVSMKDAVDQGASTEFIQSNELWVGNPPNWVDNFSPSALNIFAELYKSSGPAVAFEVKVVFTDLQEHPPSHSGCCW